MTTKRMVGVNERGLLVGEDHPGAKLTDAEVELMRRMHEFEKIGYRRLCAMFEVSKTTVRRICKYEVRCQPVERYRADRRQEAQPVDCELRSGKDRRK